MDLVISWFAFSIIPAVIAANKGRSGIGWYFISLLMSPLFAGLLVLVLAPVKKTDIGQQVEPANDRLPCPLCMELIRFGAIRCPHCQGDIASFMDEQRAERNAVAGVRQEQETGDLVGLDSTQLLNIVRYKKFPEEKRRAALERLQEKYHGSRELSEATQALPPAP